jgi:hypothetical protein
MELRGRKKSDEIIVSVMIGVRNDQEAFDPDELTVGKGRVFSLTGVTFFLLASAL